MVLLGRGGRDGGSFDVTTVTVKELVTESTPPLAVPPLSLTTTVMVAVPNWLVKIGRASWRERVEMSEAAEALKKRMGWVVESRMFVVWVGSLRGLGVRA